MKTTQKVSRTGNPVEWGLALAAGLGLILMMVALAWGVVGGANASTSPIGMLFATGLAILIIGAGGWLAVAQPYKHFDDINVPADHGTAAHDDHAIVAHESTEVTSHEAHH